MDSEKTGDNPKRPNSKVARVIEAYDLGPEFGDRLERLWTGEAEERRSLRDLADYFNRHVLESAVSDTGTSMLDGEVENVYRLLTDDEVSSGMRTEARVRLERDGVDVARLERDFVTHQAIRSYLKKYRGAEYERASEADRMKNTTESIQRLRSRTATVTEGNLDQLRTNDHITLGEFRLFVEMNVLCEECGAQYSVDELLERGGCDCQRDTDVQSTDGSS
ncbi:rod-determining factor RdfA [Haloprofundus salinisoli]|uniref:rod-determining factor RdfA n=1 Tax=Haloprofundus salinisoli TaxID=2876193 RepID=UPI001CCE179D|nr:rod-determining factor RdfA [Haloprofundus salinisoli]